MLAARRSLTAACTLRRAAVTLPRAFLTVPKDFASKGHAEEAKYFNDLDAALRAKMKKMMAAALKKQEVAKAELDALLTASGVTLPDEVKEKLVDWKLEEH
uniref:Uncharacterized protein n=1 Tax=Pinguiococcus pyrenoidosus TaxID=172671 RepID=A0A7R9UE49_9STRA|mmetsp:Transcript_7416/g.28116  ORF Transcript_7416/g.28116 Transcript_7416/m.28116 type:complete len:101 (+) Transcript_7416:111-413(+)